MAKNTLRTGKKTRPKGVTAAGKKRSGRVRGKR